MAATAVKALGSNAQSKFPVLLSTARRVAHVHSIVVRNLWLPETERPFACCFYRLLTEHGELIHESECSADAANPVWLPLSPHKVAQRLASVSVVALRIFAVTSCVHEGAASCPASVGSHVCPAALANPVLIHEETVPLCDLFHLNLDLMELPLRDLPLNTVLFRLTDGFYGRREQWAFLRRNRLIPQPTAKRGALAVLTVSEFFSGIRHILERKQALDKLATATQATKRRAAGLLKSKHQREDRASAAVSTQHRIAALRARVKAKRLEVVETKAMLEQRKLALAERTRRIRQVLASAKPSGDMKKAEDADVANERQSFRMARQMLTARQLCLVSDVRYVYPIAELQRFRKYSIRGVVLPAADLPAGDDEQVSTALGHVAHLVMLVSKYLQIPLRYSMRCMGSRSTISDDVLRPGDAFPLFAKSQDRLRFNVAIRFLQLNIRQLLVASGENLPVHDNSHMLSKLLALFAQLLGPVLAFEAS